MDNYELSKKTIFVLNAKEYFYIITKRITAPFFLEIVSVNEPHENMLVDLSTTSIKVRSISAILESVSMNRAYCTAEAELPFYDSCGE